MSIKLVPFADKVTGASDATGKVTADDINQIKTIINACIAAFFTLDNSNNVTTAVLKQEVLPTVDIFSLFNPGDFVVSNGVISLANGSSLPIAPPLTAGIVDDTADTFSATLPAGFTAIDVERTFDGGLTWAAITSLPLSVGNTAFAIGKVGLRIKATSERQHSATLFNQTAFNVAGGNSNPDTGFSPVNTFEQLDTDIVKTGNSLAWVFDGTNTNRFYANNSLKALNGTAFELRFTIDPTKMSGFIGVAQTGSGFSPNRMQWLRNSDTHGSMQAIVTNTYPPTTGVDITVPARGRIKGDGTTLTADYSLDGGVTWINIGSGPQPAMDLHIQGQFTAHDDVVNGNITNIIQKGMVTA